MCTKKSKQKCPPQKGFAPTSEKWIGSIILPCSQVRCNYITVQESVLYKRHRSTVNENLWCNRLQMSYFIRKSNFTGTQTQRTPPKCTARHRKTNPAIFQPIPDRLQSRGRSTPKRGFVVSTPGSAKSPPYPLRDIYHQHPHHYQCHHVIYLCKT